MKHEHVPKLYSKQNESGKRKGKECTSEVEKRPFVVFTKVKT